LSPEKLGEGVTSIVRVMDLTNFNGVVSEVVLENKGEILRLTEESEDFAVVIEELLLAGNLATTKSLLHVLLHLVVTWAGNLDLRLGESIAGHLLAFRLALSAVLK
jgi:hypothetical protein